MGAENQSFIISGGNEKYVKDRIKEQCENDKYEHGHGGYTGTWAEWNGGVMFHNKTFKNENQAYEYLFGKYIGKGKNQKYILGVVQKWENAIVVQFRNEEGQLNWLVGACFSC